LTHQLYGALKQKILAFLPQKTKDCGILFNLMDF